MLGFLTTLILSLPQLASPQRTAVSTGTQADVPVEQPTERKCFYLTKNFICIPHVASNQYTHLSLEQRILAFEKECEERSRSTMEEKVCFLEYSCSTMYTVFLVR